MNFDNNFVIVDDFTKCVYQKYLPKNYTVTNISKIVRKFIASTVMNCLRYDELMFVFQLKQMISYARVGVPGIS